jgi:uncharacterized protein (DUF2147 family)
MNQKHFLILYLFLGYCSVSAQSVFGKWKTFDIFDKTKEEAIVEIYKYNDSLAIKIIQIIPEEHQDDICNKCKDKNKNRPIKGLVILEGATLKNGVWQGAKILNAKNGYHYGCHLSLKNNNLLKVRGYIGYPLFGKTVYWQKVEGNFISAKEE